MKNIEFKNIKVGTTIPILEQYGIQINNIHYTLIGTTTLNGYFYIYKVLGVDTDTEKQIIENFHKNLSAVEKETGLEKINFAINLINKKVEKWILKY